MASGEREGGRDYAIADKGMQTLRYMCKAFVQLVTLHQLYKMTDIDQFCSFRCRKKFDVWELAYFKVFDRLVNTFH